MCNAEFKTVLNHTSNIHKTYKHGENEFSFSIHDRERSEAEIGSVNRPYYCRSRIVSKTQVFDEREKSYTLQFS